MNKDTQFENTIRLSQLSLSIVGIPTIELHCIRFVSFFIENWLFYIIIIWLYTDMFAGLAWLIEGLGKGRSIEELSLMAPCIAISILSSLKTMKLFYNRQLLKSLIDKFRKIHRDTIHENVVDLNEAMDTEKNIIKDAIKFINTTVFSMLLYSLIVGLSFDSIPIILMIYEYFTTGNTDFKTPFAMEYYLIESSTVLQWIIIYLHQFGSNIIVLSNMFGADSLFFIFCIYIRTYFRILSQRFENICFAREGCSICLNKLIVKHQMINELVAMMELLFSQPFLFHMTTSSMLICLSLFNITLVDDKVIVFKFSLFLGMTLTQIALVCYFGDMLMTSSILFNQAVYNCKWYDASKSDRRSVLYVLMRSQKPCKITAAGFADLNLVTFISILSTSWSYFALLKTMVKN